MSATFAGALKAHIEAGGLTLQCFRDAPPPKTPLPYVVIFEGIGRDTEPTGDFGDPAAQLEWREEAQVDVWQAAKALDTGTVTERYDLPGALVRRLRGATIGNVGDGRVYPLKVTAARRVPNPDKNLIRDTITVQALRQIGTTP